jgi:ABC-type branched-subunit amino acid transport system substrate-binding protein
VYPTVGDAATTFASWINAQGGINGHPLQVEICDTKNIPAENANCARKAVDDKVIASVGSFSLSGSQVVPTLEAASIAWFAPVVGQTAPELSSKVSFPITAGTSTLVGGVGAMVQECSNAAAVLLDTASASTQTKLINGVANAYGKTLKVILIPVAPGDMSSFVAQVKNNDCVYLNVGDGHVLQWMPAMTQLGVKARLYYYRVVQQVQTQMQGMSVVSGLPPLASPVWKSYVDAVKKYPSASLSPSVFAYGHDWPRSTWAGYVAFVAIARKAMAGGKNLTAQSFIDAASTTTSLDTGGLLPALDLTKTWDYPGSARQFNRHIILGVIEGDHVTPKGGFIDASNLYFGKRI